MRNVVEWIETLIHRVAGGYEVYRWQSKSGREAVWQIRAKTEYPH